MARDCYPTLRIWLRRARAGREHQHRGERVRERGTVDGGTRRSAGSAPPWISPPSHGRREHRHRPARSIRFSPAAAVIPGFGYSSRAYGEICRQPGGAAEADVHRPFASSISRARRPDLDPRFCRAPVGRVRSPAPSEQTWSCAREAWPAASVAPGAAEVRTRHASVTLLAACWARLGLGGTFGVVPWTACVPLRLSRAGGGACRHRARSRRVRPGAFGRRARPRAGKSRGSARRAGDEPTLAGAAGPSASGPLGQQRADLANRPPKRPDSRGARARAGRDRQEPPSSVSRASGREQIHAPWHGRLRRRRPGSHNEPRLIVLRTDPPEARDRHRLARRQGDHVERAESRSSRAVHGGHEGHMAAAPP